MPNGRSWSRWCRRRCRVAVRPVTPRREIVNAILYVLRTGCQWRAVPHDLPPWGTVWWYFRQWREAGLWEQINTTLREQDRMRVGREPTPSAAILDSQSVKTTEKGGLAAMTGARRSRAANATSWSRPRVGCGKRGSIPAE